MALVDFEKRGHQSIITLNRMDKLNAFNMDMFNTPRESCIRFRNDEDAWNAILQNFRLH